jgi:hypothetical protein
MATIESGHTLYHPETKEFVSKGKPIVSLRDAPPKYRVHRKYLRLVMTITQAAAAAGISSAELTRLFDSIVIGKRIRATGLLLSVMDWLQTGKDFNRPTATPAGAGVFVRTITVPINYADPSATAPADTAPNTEFYDDCPIEIGFANLSTLIADYSAVNYPSIVGQLITTLDIDPASPDVTPTPVRVNYDDWAGKTLLLGAGTYRMMFVYKEDGTDIVDADVTGIDLAIDGAKVYDDVTPSELAMLFNHARAQGIATGEAMPEDTAYPFIPLIVPELGYKATKLPHADRNIRLDFKGAATAFRVAYSMVEEPAPEQKAKAAVRLGIKTEGTVAEAKTANGQNITNPRHFALLPTLFRK